MNIPAIIWALIFFFIPLQRFVQIPGTESTWNALQIFFAAAIFYLYFYYEYFNTIKISEKNSAAIFSAVTIFIFLVGHATLASAQQTVSILLIIWATPLLIKFISEQKELVLKIFIITIALQSLWAVAQFVIQSDLNVSILGETIIEIGQPGVATFTGMSNQKISRAYGPYAHPNILSGSLIIALIAFALTKTSAKKMPERIYNTLWFWISLAVVLTFSRAGWIAYCLLLVVSRQTLTKAVRNVSVLIMIITLLPLIVGRTTDVRDEALPDRLSGLQYAQEISTNQSLITGVGWGNYEETLQKYFEQKKIVYHPWDIAPVHNSLILLIAEMGLLLMLAIIGLAAWRYAAQYSQTWPYLTPLIPLLLLDHYLVTQLASLLYLSLLMILAAKMAPAPTSQKYAIENAPAKTPTPTTQL